MVSIRWYWGVLKASWGVLVEGWIRKVEIIADIILMYI